MTAPVAQRAASPAAGASGWTVTFTMPAGERARALRAWLSGRGLAPVGEPIVARYDPPWTPWFLRRNEVWFALDDAGAQRPT